MNEDQFFEHFKPITNHLVDDAPHEKWDTISFVYQGDSSFASNFSISHPLTKDKSRIDYHVVEIRFSQRYPFDGEWTVVVSDKNMADQIMKEVAPFLKQYRESLALGYRPSLCTCR